MRLGQASHPTLLPWSFGPAPGLCGPAPPELFRGLPDSPQTLPHGSSASLGRSVVLLRLYPLRSTCSAVFVAALLRCVPQPSALAEEAWGSPYDDEEGSHLLRHAPGPGQTQMADQDAWCSCIGSGPVQESHEGVGALALTLEQASVHGLPEPHAVAAEQSLQAAPENSPVEHEVGVESVTLSAVAVFVNVWEMGAAGVIVSADVGARAAVCPTIARAVNEVLELPLWNGPELGYCLPACVKHAAAAAAASGHADIDWHCQSHAALGRCARRSWASLFVPLQAALAAVMPSSRQRSVQEAGGSGHTHCPADGLQAQADPSGDWVHAAVAAGASPRAHETEQCDDASQGRCWLSLLTPALTGFWRPRHRSRIASQPMAA